MVAGDFIIFLSYYISVDTIHGTRYSNEKDY